MKRFIAVSLLLVPLSACSLWTTTPPEEPEVIVTERPETKNVIYRGTLQTLGASIYMEGTHRLELEDGRFVLLESNGLILDEYMGKDVEVSGSTRATIEGSAIIMSVERIADLTPPVASSEAMIESSSSAAAESSSVTAMPVSSAALLIASARPVVIASSVAPTPASSAAPVVAPPVSSAAAAVSSESSVNAELEARVKTMAKANMAPANWTQQYCSPAHLSFCFPIHKNWYFTSFGATSSSSWHVELSSEVLETLGDGPIVVVLVQGTAPGPDGQVIVDGGTATGIRAWSNNRHFVISAPAALESAIRYITQELRAAPTQASSVTE